MYVLNKLVENLNESLSVLDGLAQLPFDEDLPLDVEVLKNLNNIIQKVELVRDGYYSQFEKNYEWGRVGFSSGAQAISLYTHTSFYSAKKSLDRAEFVDSNDIVRSYIEDGKITTDHIDVLIRYYKKDYFKSHLLNDVSRLLESAEILTATKFSLLMLHWKFNIESIDRDLDRIEQYENRFLTLYQRPNGDWDIEGVLDPMTGELLSKALEDITSKIYRDTDSEKLDFYSKTKANVDAIAMLSRGYISTETTAIKDEKQYNYSPVLTADVIIDLSTITNNGVREDFFDRWMVNPTPISRAHDRKYVEQLLCDSKISFPLKKEGQIVDLGRSVRIAPKKYKRMLALQNDSCSLDGCNIPARWCDAHHIQHWIHGGTTKIENLALLCQRHHTMVHIDTHFEQKVGEQLYKQKPPQKPPQLQPQKRPQLQNTG